MAKRVMSWKRKGITKKFRLIFSLLLGLVLLSALTGYLSFEYIDSQRSTIQTSSRIGQLVMEMDRGLELARRLHGNFFMYYDRIGLQKAHEQYAQPSIREIAQVITRSKQLKKILFNSDHHPVDDIEQADINLYLAFAKRFADTSIEAVELTSRRAAPENGIVAQLLLSSASAYTLLEHRPELLLMFFEARSHLKDYLIHQQRFQMQSSLNILDNILSQISHSPSTKKIEDQKLTDNIASIQRLGLTLASIDHDIRGKLRDFQLQAKTVAPISNKLIRNTQKDTAAAEQGIERAMKIARMIMIVNTLCTLLILFYIVRLVHTSITCNVIELTRTASAHSEGRLDVRARVTDHDEFGQLATIYNNMAERLSDMIYNLEGKVATRTAELSLSEERFRSLVNDLPQIAVQGFDVRGVIKYWNKASEALYGYSEEEALGKEFIELIFPHLQRNEARLQIQAWLDEETNIPAVERTLQQRNGKAVSVFNSYAMQMNSLGEKQMYCVGIDLAELKQAQERAKVNVSLYRQLFDHSSSGVIVYKAIDEGSNFVIMDVNHASEQIDQVKRKDIVGRSVTEIFPGITENGLFEVFQSVWKTGKPEHLQATVYSDSRIRGWRQNRVYKLPSGKIVAVYDDVTAQMNAENEKHAMELRLQRAQKMETIGLMAGGIAHDLNNILSAIVGYPELLLLQLSPENELRKPLGAIKSAGERAAAIVEDLLTVARGVASAKKSDDLNILIEEYLDSPEFYQLQERFPNIRFECDFRQDIPPILCSPVHVKKCIMNLATNGAEAIEISGSVTIATRSCTPDVDWLKNHGLEETTYIVLTINDTGTGIAEKDLKHIFEPFYTKKVMGKISGTGLGLSVVWNTMKDHDGAVFVSSDAGGTMFELYFPIADEFQDSQVVTTDHTSLQGSGEKILVVDDEPQQRNLATEMLEHFGYTVTSKSSGEDAISYLQDNHADVILLDMLMDPGINGRDTYRLIKDMKPTQKAIIASGYSDNIDVQETILMGAGKYIKKPYAMLDLAKAVQQELQRG
ncbi:MAG: PAS domain S-box-containing protein [Desulforhopalus sp.]|jgi:PAS domain S-box-containing protein